MKNTRFKKIRSKEIFAILFIALTTLLLITCASFPKESSSTVELEKQTILNWNAEWEYWYGTTASPLAPAGWNTGSDSETWHGPIEAPIGYGIASKTPEGISYTPIFDDKTPTNALGADYSVATVYYRTTVDIEPGKALQAVTATAYYDDLLILYVNGKYAGYFGGLIGAEGNVVDLNNIDASAQKVSGQLTGATKIDPIPDNQPKTIKIDGSLFNEGKNIIAAQLIQENAHSSDSLMALKLEGYMVNAQTLLSMNAEWHYWYGEKNIPAPSGWQNPDFNTSDWFSNQGPIGYASSSATAKLNAAGLNFTAINKPDSALIYFVTEVEIENIDAIKVISGLAHYDDAAIVYINGVERFKLGVLPENFDEASLSYPYVTKVGDPVINQVQKMSPEWFKNGVNTIAIMMAQDTEDSSDCLMGFEITAYDTLILEEPDRFNMNFNGDPATRMGFTWYSDGAGSTGMVQYAPAASFKNWNSAASVKADRTGSLEIINKAILTNLKPNTKYVFRAGGDGAWKEGSFTTAEKGKGDGRFSFMHVTDQQGSKASDFQNWADNIAGALEVFPEIDFIINTGDFVNDGLSEAEWASCMNLAEDTLLHIPMVPLTGNHEGYDYRNSFWNHFNVERQEKTDITKGSYYSFNYENVHFTVLNTDEKENEDLSAAQLVWMEADLKKAKADPSIQWIIVGLHRGLYSSGDHSTDGDVINMRTSVGKLLDAYQVDMVLSGHDHVYIRSSSIYNNVAQEYKTITENGIEYALNPRGTTHIVPATISVKNYVLNKNADYRAVQPARTGGSYENGRPEYISYSFSPDEENLFYPEGIMPAAAVFVKIDIAGNTLVMNSYAVKSGTVEKTPFDSYAIKKDGSAQEAIQTTNAKLPALLNPEDYPYPGEVAQAFDESKYIFGDIYDPEAYFKENHGTQGDVWYYYYENMGKLYELTPMKGKAIYDGNTKESIDSNCLYSQFPDAVNIGNDSVQNGTVRLYDGVFDGNPYYRNGEIHEALTLTPYSTGGSDDEKDDIIVAWKAPKSGQIRITDWNPEFVGIIPVETNSHNAPGFNGARVNIRLKKGNTAPTAAADYIKDSVSLLASHTFPEDGDGVRAGGAPRLIDKGGPFDGQYLPGYYVQTKGIITVEKGDYIYFSYHQGSVYGWRGIALDSIIKYVDGER